MDRPECVDEQMLKEEPGGGYKRSERSREVYMMHQSVDENNSEQEVGAQRNRVGGCTREFTRAHVEE
jgi:hypothetical protein